MTRDDFLNGIEFKFEEMDSDSYFYDGHNIIGPQDYEVLSVGEDSFTVDFGVETQAIRFSILERV